MSDKTKIRILTIVTIIISVWILVASFFLLILWQNAVAEGEKPVIDGDFLMLQLRVSALEDGTTLEKLAAEQGISLTFEVDAPED